MDNEEDFTQEEITQYSVAQTIADSSAVLSFTECLDLAERIIFQLKSDDELNDYEYYCRHGFSRTAPVCTESDCPCED